jgi:SHS2 domain-containing protein
MSGAPPAHHRFEDHTGEVAVTIEAPTLPELFVQAGRALAELLLGEVLPAPDAGPRVTVEVVAPDRAALLVEWLNELLFQADVHQAVFTGFVVQELADGRVTAELAGVAGPALRGEVKAATLHDARVEPAQGGDGWRAHVVLDV